MTKSIFPSVRGEHSTLGLEEFLEEGESLSPALPMVEGDLRKWYGYNWYPIKPAPAAEGTEAEDSSGVLIVVEPSEGTHPDKLEADLTLYVQALNGNGRLLLMYPETGVFEEHGLDSQQPVCAVIGQGAVYCYVNDGENELVIRDDSVPPFRDGDEIASTGDEINTLCSAFTQ